MSDDGDRRAPADEHALRMDTDRTRDELADTLDSIETRLTPRELLASLQRAWRASPLKTAGLLASPVLAIGAVIALRIVMRSRRG